MIVWQANCVLLTSSPAVEEKKYNEKKENEDADDPADDNTDFLLTRHRSEAGVRSYGSSGRRGT
jgi:hypothetical protein